jgi:HEAT repeats
LFSLIGLIVSTDTADKGRKATLRRHPVLIVILNEVQKLILQQRVMQLRSLIALSVASRMNRVLRGVPPETRRARSRFWLRQALLGASLAAGSPAFAQYPPSGQPYSAGYPPAYPAVYPQQLPSQGAENQSDEQLLTIGRLLEQQGRYAQAQKIYTELERRRVSGLQQPTTMPPNAAYPPQGPVAQTGMVQPAVPQPAMAQFQGAIGQPQSGYAQPQGALPQGVISQSAWQPTPPQMVNSGSAMPMPPQTSPRVNYAVSNPAELPTTSVAPTSQATARESFVVDREYTPAPKTVGAQEVEGWRNAITPVPTALQTWSVDRPTPYVPQVTAKASQSSAGSAYRESIMTEPTALPDLPIAPVAPIGTFGNPFPPAAPPAAAVSEPPRFLQPSALPPNRQFSAFPGNATAVPPTLGLRPLAEKNLPAFEPERDTPDQLSKQTDSIRIIPGHRLVTQLKPETDGSLKESLEQQTEPPVADKTSARWTPNAVAAQPIEQPAPLKSERADAESPPRFDLVTSLASADFREIHTPQVLEGLELLARPEPQHRALGAMRIGAAGAEARTALPVLRHVLATETNRKVSLRLAEAVLKIQPNDRIATGCLSDLLSDRNDWELRQNAANALGNAARARNTIAMARLTDALDDPHPNVRAAAAGSLALFGPAAIDSVSRLESAATTDIPSVQRVSSMALIAIRGSLIDSSRKISATEAPGEPAEFRASTSGTTSPLPSALPTGRTSLSDRTQPAETSEPKAVPSGSTNLPPKIAPVDRVAGSRTLMPAPEFAEEDAASTNAARETAPPKAPSSVPPAATQAAPLDPAQLLLQPSSATPAATAETASPFLLQSEAGESKAGSVP